MKAVVQRVTRALVRVERARGPEVVGEIGAGMLVLLGVLKGDTGLECDELALKVAQFRFFQDAAGKMNLSALELKREVLLVSQFTLAADGSSGRRPSFDRAAPPEEAEPLYQRFVWQLRAAGLKVATGEFGAKMQVELVNDGPVTFVLECAPAYG